MKATLTAQQLLVLPINKPLLEAHIFAIANNAGLIPDDTDIGVSGIDAMLPNIDNVVVDYECCYCHYSNKMLYIDKDGKAVLDYLHPIAVRFETLVSKDEGNESRSVYIGFEMFMPLTELLKFCSKAVSLFEFMGSRYNYPRIKTNTREFLEVVTETYIAAQYCQSKFPEADQK